MYMNQMSEKSVHLSGNALFKYSAGIFFVSVFAFSLVAWSRMGKASSNNHFAYLAQNWLQGQLNMTGRPPHGNDWARVTILHLKNSEKLKGRFVGSGKNKKFKTTRGRLVKVSNQDIGRVSYKWYVSFPPAPALLMLPFVKAFGINANDVILTIILSGITLVFFFLVLIESRVKGYHERSLNESLFLTSVLGFGTVYFFSSVRGEVWFTAHITGLFFLTVFLWSFFRKNHLLAGIALGFAFLSRTPMLFAGLLYPFSMYQENGISKWKEDLQKLILFSIPVIISILLAVVHNYLRFDNAFEFGHNYLNIRWQGRIQKYGLFNYEYLSRNLSVALTLLPRITFSKPWIQISPHGMALWITTPVFFYLFKSDLKKRFVIPMLVVSGIMAVMVLSYQNSGFVQFGYRFSLDFTVFLLLIMAFSRFKFTKLFYTLAILGMLINLFGAVTFSRFMMFYPRGSFLFFTT